MNSVLMIGLLSDTHGHLPRFVHDGLTDLLVTHIIHAGDVGEPNLLAELQRIAPTTWVCGNMDSRSIGPKSAVAEVGDSHLYVLHNLYDIDIDPGAAGMCAVVHGHLHEPSIKWKDKILYINPGSCVYPRGGHPPSFAVIRVQNDRLIPEIIFKD
ncbi:MAG: metallophosphoesterase family protein [Deltaproteobacteria bacterium]|nr:metallophosphoesterase family protein [Deltaproteobacteria bacterium]MBN2670789.1 metallophosphoesterase family protein [Deltaproteobacteria bacterium]